MKYLIILGDGMADEPIPRLGGRTPLQAARKPTIDRIAALGASGILDTVPEGFAPGSEIAHLSLLGYDVPSVFEGRGSLEAAGMGVEIGRGEMVMRCNLITVEQERIRNHSAGHISTAEAAELIDFLQRRLGSDDVRFHTGVSYRHLLTIRGGDKRLHTVGPHDVPDRPFAEVLPSAADAAAEPTARQLRELIFRSQELLADHPVNRARRAAGKQPATSIWPWSPGYRPRMQTLQERYAPIRNGSVISAVDLIRGIGVCAGLTPVEVEGATGLYDTNYEGKAEARAAGAARRGFRLPAYRSERRGGPRRGRRTESTDDRSARRTSGAADLRSGLRMGVSRLAGHPSRPPDALPAAHPHRRAGPLHDLAERLPSRHGGGLRRTERPTGPLRPPAGRRLHRPLHPRYRITDEKYKFPHDEILQHKPPHARSLAPRGGRRQHGARQRALHARTDRAAARRILRRDRPSGPPPDRLPRGRRLFRRGDRTRNAAAHRPRHVLLRHSGCPGRRRHLGARTLPRPDDGLQGRRRALHGTHPLPLHRRPRRRTPRHGARRHVGDTAAPWPTGFSASRAST